MLSWIDWLIDWLSDWLSDWWIEGVTDWWIDGLIDPLRKRSMELVAMTNGYNSHDSEMTKIIFRFSEKRWEQSVKEANPTDPKTLRAWPRHPFLNLAIDVLWRHTLIEQSRFCSFLSWNLEKESQNEYQNSTPPQHLSDWSQLLLSAKRVTSIWLGITPNHSGWTPPINLQFERKG